MVKIYLTENTKLAMHVRDLIAVDAFSGLLTMGYIMPAINEKESDAIHCIQKYCRKKIAEQLNKCELFGQLSKKEEDEECDSHRISYITKVTTGMGCVLANEAESVLKELQRLNICITLQKALRTGKHAVIEI